MTVPSSGRLLALASHLVWLAIMAAGPAVFFPWGMSPFAPAKRDVFYSLALIQFALLGIRHLSDMRGFARRLVGVPAVWPLAAGVALVGVRLHYGIDPRTALAPLLDLTMAGGLALGLFAERDPGLAWKMLMAYAVSAAFAGVYGLLQFAGQDPFSWQAGFAGGAPGSTYGNPLFLASGLAAALPAVILFALGHSRPARIFGWIVAAAALAALVVTQARGAWIGAAAGIAAALGWAFARRRTGLHRGRAGLAALAVLLAGVVALLSVPNPMNRHGLFVARHAATVLDPFRAEYQGRWLLWHATALMVRDRPVTGWGLGQLRVRYTDYQGRLLSLPGFHGIPYHSTAHAHQDLLQVAAERGIIGLGLFAWFLAAVLVPLIRRIADPPDDPGGPPLRTESASIAAGCILLAWLADGLVNGPLNLPPSSYLFWLFAVLASRPEGLDEDIDDGRQQGWRLASFARPGRQQGWRTASGAGDGAKQDLATASSADDGERPDAIPAFGAVLLSALALLFLLRPFARDLASEGYLLAGNQALERGDAPLALPYCLRAWALSYEDRRHHFYLGEAYYNQGQYREAEEEFARDVAVNPSYHSGWHNLGLARYALGASGPALDAFIRALAVNPADGDTRGMIMRLKTGAKPAIDRAKTTR